MAKKNKGKKAGAPGKNQTAKTAKRSQQKVMDAFQMAERAVAGYDNDSDDAQDDDELQVRDGVLDARHLLGDDYQSDQDSEINSDDALGSDDDYDVLDSKFSQTLRDKAKAKRLAAKRGEALDSDDESYHSIDESEMVPLSMAWDMDEADLHGTPMPKTTELVLDDDRDSDSSEEESDSSESESESESEEEDVFAGFSDDEEHGGLSSTLAALKASMPEVPKEKKKLVKEARDESEYAIPTGGAKLSLNDMLNVGGEGAAEATLIDGDTRALAVPLPQRVQQRNDRKAAYELTKEEVSKWRDTIETNRSTDVLKFPMTAPADLPAPLLAQEVPGETELERKVREMLVTSKLEDESKEATFQEIQTAKLSPEELMKRTAELRMMRELMFRDERRAKRIKKIKSKTYHKIKKKERLRNQELVESEEEDNEDHDMRRAQERMSLKHKTQGAWAKSMIKSGRSKDAESRAELDEMLATGERLRAKQMGYEDGVESDGGASDIERDYDDDDAEADDASKQKLGKGVLAMSFMTKSQASQRDENIKEIDLLRKLEEGGELDADDAATSVDVYKNQGRRVYAPSAGSHREEEDNENADLAAEIAEDNSKSLANRMRGGRDRQVTVKEVEAEPEVAVPATKGTESTENPWLTVGVSTPAPKRSSKITVVDDSSSKLAKAAAKIAKAKAPEKKRGADVLIHTEKTLTTNANDDDDQPQFTQQQLISEAFAGDDVVAEFEAEKRAVIEDEDDKEEDVTLPGWGDWAGESVKPRKKRKYVVKVDGVMRADQRRDKNLKGVIINEKTNKKNLKYASPTVPFPYQTSEQYERSLRMPLGQEWTTRDTHQRMVMPKVVTKQGEVIDPLKAPFK
ncbi:U3 small nucleolar RNA-associated protein 14 [Diutina catenulata]